MTSSPPHLFEGYGIELEYMVVRRDSLDILPITDKVLFHAAGAPTADIDRGPLGWSNELVLHVIEIKNSGPVDSLDGLAGKFAGEVREINAVLDPMGGCLLPGGMHPWMDPHRETRLWPHGSRQIYQAYDRIFDCRGHGWSNLQSVHLNLGFNGDEEFARLHAAVRLILPLLPAIAASSPFVEGRPSGLLDTRLYYYRRNQSRIPSITGLTIPERISTRAEYVERIHNPIFRDIAPLDPDNILRREWLNSRGAIARFERSAIEIRLIDIQECPSADLAVASAVIGALRCLTGEEWSSRARQQEPGEELLLDVLLRCIESGEKAVIDQPSYLALFSFPGPRATGSELWTHMAESAGRLLGETMPYQVELRRLLRHGTLAGRLLRAAGPDPGRGRLREVYRELARCLAHDELFLP
ncbi:MAG TPA: glutamate--cysteine ligase [Desulfobacteraceae bacterium]|nr:glutamate--cysteine ligase [Desulfobacteraceae bacterium]